MTDYLGSIGPREDLEGKVRELLEFLLAHKDRWDVASLMLPAWGDEFPSYLKSVCLPHFAREIRWETDIPQFYVGVQLPRDFQAYLSSLGKKTRTHLRQYLRAADRADARLDVYRQHEATKYVDALFQLNSQNWRVFKNDGAREFVTGALRALAAAAEPAVMGVFKIDGEACGAFQGFENGTTCGDSGI
jgi:hypothetical protein